MDGERLENNFIYTVAFKITRRCSYPDGRLISSELFGWQSSLSFAAPVSDF